MNKRIISLIVAIIAGIVAIGFVHNYIRQKEALIANMAQDRQVIEVVVALTDIPKYTRIQSNMLTMKRVPISSIQPGALDTIDPAIGKVSAVNILKGEFITSNKLTFDTPDRTLALSIPEGKRAMTFQVDRVTLLEGMINPGDKVDVAGTFPFSQTVGDSVVRQTILVPMFENITTLAVGERTSSREIPKSQPTTITLALAPEQAALLTFALQMGKITLFLRSPLEKESFVRRQPVTVDILWEKLLSISRATPPPKKDEPPTVEVYIDGKRSLIQLE